jgi:hypothetical protein
MLEVEGGSFGTVSIQAGRSACTLHALSESFTLEPGTAEACQSTFCNLCAPNSHVVKPGA